MKAWLIACGILAGAVVIAIVLRRPGPPGVAKDPAGNVAPSAHLDPTTEDADELAFEALEQSGIDLAKPLALDFFFFFPDEPSARAAMRSLEGDGFKVALAPPTEEDAMWACVATRELVPERGAMGALSAHLVEVAGRYGGIYDSWAPRGMDD